MSDHHRFAEPYEIRAIGMHSPVRCTCGGVYDLGTVTVIARYADCSVWNAPCCGRQADDRGETGWKSLPDYTRVQAPPPEVVKEYLRRKRHG
jgi:hypothetical protein